jgi:hypothetical protein
VHTLTPEQILAVWETGREQHELDRALTLLAAVSPATDRDALAALSIGERDERLLQLRTSLFGSRAACFAECPECAAHLEFAVDTSTFMPTRIRNLDAQAFERGGTHVRFRLPSSRDLADVVSESDSTTGLRRLVERCVVEITGSAATSARDLPAEFVAGLSHAMLEADPNAEINLALKCPDCGHAWHTLFDIADFFWDEISAQAKRLLREIDALARAYSWSEREILSLSARRRQSYLELIES